MSQYTSKLTDVRSVVKVGHSWTFDSRGLVDIDLEKIRQKAEVLPAGIPTGKRADAQLLNLAFEQEAEQELVGSELQSRGYSDEVVTRALIRAELHKSAFGHQSQQVLLDLMRRDMSPTEYQKLKKDCDKGHCDVIDEAAKREPWVIAVVDSWE